MAMIGNAFKNVMVLSLSRLREGAPRRQGGRICYTRLAISLSRCKIAVVLGEGYHEVAFQHLHLFSRSSHFQWTQHFGIGMRVNNVNNTVPTLPHHYAAQ